MPPMISTNFDVFLSHNGSEKDCVKELANLLTNREVKVWLDEWELVPGRPWQEAIEEIIGTVQVAAVVVGKDGFGPWQNRETSACLAEFVERRLPVIPVLLPGAPSNIELPLFLKQFTWVDLRDGLTDEGLDRLEWGVTGRRPTSSEPRSQPRSKLSDTRLLHLMWDYLDGPLQDAFALAYNKKCREGKNRISTRDLFQALIRITDPAVMKIVNSLPLGSMPDPPLIDTPIDDTILNEAPLLSGCVAESLSNFETFKSKTRKVSSADILVDIGKFGHGSSVKRLRDHGVTSEMLDDIVGQLGLTVLLDRG